LRFQLLLFIIALLGASCVSTRKNTRFYSHTLKERIEKSTVFSNSFTGFTLMEPETGRILCDIQGDKYFTPASNTKILTLYTCLHLLGDSLPRLRYERGLAANQSAEYRIQGMADPTWLSPYFQVWQPNAESIFSEKSLPKQLFLMPGATTMAALGPGWCWDDTPDAYSPEMSALPLYGNMNRVQYQSGQWQIIPPVAPEHQQFSGVKTPSRKAFSPVIELPITGDESAEPTDIPMYEAAKYALQQLNDTLKWDIHPGNTEKKLAHTWYVCPVDTVYKRLMHQSDNFIAEQLLLMCAAVKLDTLNQGNLIQWATQNLFNDLPQAIKWVDGSGLSRYNLNTPRNQTEILRRLWLEQPKDRLWSLFPAGGQSGTIENWYQGDQNKPYVFAKTGTMSGVHCLSGYLVTNTGKTLIFSFMHNNFVGSNRAWKTEMQQILEQIRDFKR
jgi:D-alanyl-D-alanine carboxypeptidase/D-alanyl-D-alanine-endopeptidase (penicillin-binding protein 4)